MKLVVEGSLAGIPRPYVWRDWEWRTISFGIGLGRRMCEDDILYVGFRHELSDRELELIDRFILRGREEPAADVIHSAEEFHERYGMSA